MAQLYFKYGAMGSSKTANALMARFNYEERGQKTLLVKPRMDQRDGDHMVHSRIGLEYPCVYFDEMRALSEDALKENACIIRTRPNSSPRRKWTIWCMWWTIWGSP